MDQNNQFWQNFQMFLQQNPQMMGMMGMNPQMMGMNPQMMGMNPQMMGMNPQMMGMNPQMMGMNPQMMGMNPGMFMGNNNIDVNYIKNMLLMMGYNEEMINNFINMYFQNNQQNQPQQNQPQQNQPQQNQPQQNTNNSELKNLIFKHKTTRVTYNIQVNNNETLGSVINKYINKSGDNHINLYISNGKKLNESLTVAEAGLIDYCLVDVVAIDELEGALIK